MAFLKRTWLARLGTGLNKFLIGDKGADGKQTLTNSPDTVVQEGDVISADNLNDLEDRIDNGFTGVGTEMNGMKLTKIWQNESPTSSFAEQTLESISDTDLVIEYALRVDSPQSVNLFQHLRKTNEYGNLFYLNVGSANALFYSRQYTFMSNSRLRFFDAYRYRVSDNTETTQNGHLVPIAIYKVGNIYNS